MEVCTRNCIKNNSWAHFACAVSTSSLRLGLGLEQGRLSVIGVLQIQVPVVWRVRLGNQPRPVQSLHHLFWERSLLQVAKISLKLAKATHSDQDAIPATVVHLESRVIADPAQSGLDQAKAMLLNDGLDDAQSFKVCILEIALAVESSSGAGVTVSTLCGHIVRLILAGEKAAGDRVVDHNIKTVAPAGRNQLSLDVAGYVLKGTN